MTSYFIRRFLLIIPTFIGITLAVFLIMHFVPGGPIERQIMNLKMAIMQEGGVGSGQAVGTELPAAGEGGCWFYPWRNNKRCP